jgi:RHS repeat-associated protein
MNQPFSASNPNGTPTALSQFTNNQWLGTGAGYDANGNATAIPGTTNETFTYDGENRVATANANGTITYVYDGEGRRVSKAASTFTTNYLYDAFGKVVQETTIPVTGTSYPTQAPFTGTEYPIRDHLGSTRVSLNSQGQVVRRWDFLPFGEEIVAGVGGRGADYEPSNSVYPATPDAVLRKFTGKERDAETGLDYFGARYFSGAQGRFTSPDWADKPEPVPFANLSDPQTLNLYGYVRNNPLSKADPDGHCGLIPLTCKSAGEFFSSLPDRVTGGLKGEANLFFGANLKPSNDEQADAMNVVKQDGPTIIGYGAMVLPGPKGEIGKEAISMTEAVDKAAAHTGGGVMEETGKGTNYQFRNTTTEGGNSVSKMGRFDVNPADPHVAKDGAHLNLETHVNGKPVGNEHIPIDPKTVRPGDHP